MQLRRTMIGLGSVIVLTLAGLTAVVIFKKRDIVTTVQTEKVTRRNLTELVLATALDDKQRQFLALAHQSAFVMTRAAGFHAPPSRAARRMLQVFSER